MGATHTMAAEFSSESGPQGKVGGGALRYRPWQRLRGQRAFRRERNIGVYRHSGAALLRILPPWEAEQPAPAAAERRLGSGHGDSGATGGSVSGTTGGSAAAGGAVGATVSQPFASGGSAAHASDLPTSMGLHTDGVSLVATAAGDHARSTPAVTGGRSPRASAVAGGRTGRRLGVVASRKVGNAVARNRAKRVWREIFRLNQHTLPSDCDVLVIVRKDFAKASRAEMEALFADAARRARRAFGGS